MSKIAESHLRISSVETRVDGLETDVAELKAAQLERIMARAESAQAWSAVEAAVQATPPEQIEE